MAIEENQVLDALRRVMDPDLHRDIVALGFIKNLQIKDGSVALQIELTTPACPVKEQLRHQAREAILAIPGVTEVAVEMTARVQTQRAPQAADILSEVHNIVAVASGKGGVGKSTTAVNLALALHLTGARVGILDADIHGPSLPKLLGLQGKPQGVEDESSDKKIEPMIAYGIKVMSMGMFMPEDAPMIWRGPMVGMAVEQMLRDVNWGELDYLVVDLPPGTGDAQLTLTQKVPLTGVVIVSTPQDVALADVKKGINMFRQVKVPILGIIENMSYYICPDCGHRAEIFSHGGARRHAEAAGVEFLGEIPLVEDIRVVSDAGHPIVVALPDNPSSVQYRLIAGRIAARISILRHRAQKMPRIVVQ